MIYPKITAGRGWSIGRKITDLRSGRSKPKKHRGTACGSRAATRFAKVPRCMQEVVLLYGGCSRRLELCVKRAFHFPLAEHQFVFWILLVDGQFRVFDDWAISVKEFPCPVRTFSIHSINRNFYAPYRAFSSIYTQVRSIQLKHLLSNGFYHDFGGGARTEQNSA